MDQRILLGHLIVGAIAIALDRPVCTLEQPGGCLATAAGIVVEQDDPLAWRAGDPDPHPVFGGCRLIAVDDLDRRFVDADVTAAAQPFIHQVDQRLDPFSQCNDPGGLRCARQTDPVTGKDRLLPVQRQCIDVFAGDQMRQQPRRRIGSR